MTGPLLSGLRTLLSTLRSIVLIAARCAPRFATDRQTLLSALALLSALTLLTTLRLITVIASGFALRLTSSGLALLSALTLLITLTLLTVPTFAFAFLLVALRLTLLIARRLIAGRLAPLPAFRLVRIPLRRTRLRDRGRAAC